MWETICDAQAGFCTHSSNSKFLSKFSREPLSGISDQKAPPNEKLQIWDDQSLLQNTPQMKKFRFEMTKVYSGIPPLPKWKTSDWRWPKLLWNTPPPQKLNFKFEMTKVYSGIPPPTPPKWKTSDLRWPKFTPEYPSPPPVGWQSWRSYVETNLYPPWIPLVSSVGVSTDCIARWSCYILYLRGFLSDQTNVVVLCVKKIS